MVTQTLSWIPRLGGAVPPSLPPRSGGNDGVAGAVVGDEERIFEGTTSGSKKRGATPLPLWTLLEVAYSASKGLDRFLERRCLLVYMMSCSTFCSCLCDMSPDCRLRTAGCFSRAAWWASNCWCVYSGA